MPRKRHALQSAAEFQLKVPPELRRLRTEEAAARIIRRTGTRVFGPGSKYAPAPDTKYKRLPRVTIAPGIHVSTRPGSLYSTLLKVLAALGHLEEQDQLFGGFGGRPVVSTAHSVFRKIAAPVEDVIAQVRADEEFAEHCAKRTEWYRRRIAQRDLHAISVAGNRKIFDSRGRWIGDVEEAISILRGARMPPTEEEIYPNDPDRPAHRNVRILRQPKLLFGIVSLDGKSFCVLFRERWLATVRRIAAMVGGSMV